MTKKLIKLVFITVGLGIFLYLVSTSDFRSDEEIMIRNYQEKQTQITELKRYFVSIVPSNTSVHIEFDNDEELAIFSTSNKAYYNLNISSLEAYETATSLGWNIETLKILKSKLDNANCISIENGNPATIGFKRQSFGMFLYKIFDQSLSDSLCNKYNDGCRFIYYTDTVILEFGGGVFGAECFSSNTKKK